VDLVTYLRAQWDRVAGCTCIAVGAGLAVSGAVQMSRSETILSQLSYLGSGAMIGLFLLVLGIGLLVSAGLRDEWRKLDQIHAAIQSGRVEPAPELALAGEIAVTNLRDAPNGASQSATLPVLR
jgi:hypothetical protein